MLGLLLGVANNHLILGWAGVLVGIFMGWFVAAIDFEKNKTKEQK